MINRKKTQFNLTRKALSAAALLVIAGLAHSEVQESAGVQCSPASIKVEGVHSLAKTHYTVRCQLNDNRLSFEDLLSLEFKGVMPHETSAPYTVNAHYLLKTKQEGAGYQAQSEDVAQSSQAAQAGAEEFKGKITSVTASLAALPTQFSGLSKWDSASQTLSVQESPGVWRIYSLKTTPEYSSIHSTLAEGESIAYHSTQKEVQVGSHRGLSDAGYASAAVSQGKTYTKYVLDEKASRFSAAPAQAPVVKMVQGLRSGKLENLVGATRAANQEALRSALILLDRSPKDITRAWTAGAIAKFLGLSQEVRYIELKVAANNPQLLEDFKTDLERIKSYQPPI